MKRAKGCKKGDKTSKTVLYRKRICKKLQNVGRKGAKNGKNKAKNGKNMEKLQKQQK